MASKSVVFWEVDTQADFVLPGGALYVPGAEKTLPNLKRLVDVARSGRVFLVSSACHHAPDDSEFETFGPHCIRNTPGARIVSDGLADSFLRVPNESNFDWPPGIDLIQQVIFEKQRLDVFSNPQAGALVEKLGDVRYVVFGVVTEYCVGLAAKGLLHRGHRVSIVKDAIETLDVRAGSAMLDELKALGVDLISTDEALALVA
jgi:nicotinamidase/pyrazinamidase